MIYPNKHIRFEESIIFKMISILELENHFPIDIKKLYSLTKAKFNDIDEFIVALDVLFVLDKIEIDFENEQINYVRGNSL